MIVALKEIVFVEIIIVQLTITDGITSIIPVWSFSTVFVCNGFCYYDCVLIKGRLLCNYRNCNNACTSFVIIHSMEQNTFLNIV